jgi:hypothetical protein
MYYVRHLLENKDEDYNEPPLGEGKKRTLPGFTELAFVAPVLDLSPTAVEQDFPSENLLAHLANDDLQKVFVGVPGNNFAGFDILEFHQSQSRKFIVAYFSECKFSFGDSGTVLNMQEVKKKFFNTMKKVVNCYGNEKHKQWIKETYDHTGFWDKYPELIGLGLFQVTVEGVQMALEVRFAVWAFRTLSKDLINNKELANRSIAVLDSDAILEILPPTLRGIPLLDMGKNLKIAFATTND